MATEHDVARAIARLDDLAGQLRSAGAPSGLPWWGPAADAWRSDVERDAAALQTLISELRRLRSRPDRPAAR